MTNLSQDELSAGISRTALAKINRNGKAHTSLGEHLAARAESGVLTPERLCVIDTYDHCFDIVNLDGWRFRIRDLRRSDTKLIQVELCLDRPELELLGDKIRQILKESPAPKTVKR